MSVSEIIAQTEHKMKATVEHTREEFVKIRTGRASTGLLDQIKVDYYGCPTPLNQVAQVGVGDARTLTVQPWEKNMVKVVEKAIRDSDLGLNPATSGDVIRVPLPPLTEERRRELSKVVRGMGEDSKVAIRNLRRDANTHVERCRNRSPEAHRQVRGGNRQGRSGQGKGNHDGLRPEDFGIPKEARVGVGPAPLLVSALPRLFSFVAERLFGKDR